MAFLRYKTTGFSWAVAYPAGEWAALFARGEAAAVVTERDLVETGTLASVRQGRLAGIGDPYRSAATGALQLPVADGSWQTLLFQAGECQWYDWDRGIVRTVPWTQVGNWGTALPADWREGLDALLQAPDGPGGSWRTYFFKGSRVLTLDWSGGVVRECAITSGPDEIGADGWADLPDDLRSDFDHLLPLAPDSDGERRTLIVKGGQGCILNWGSGPEQAGALTALLHGLAALPAEFTTPTQPVSGRYTLADTETTVDLRVDLEGERPLHTVSGDIFRTVGGTTTYADSFRAAAPDVRVHDDRFVVRHGSVAFANTSDRTHLELTLPRSPVGAPRGHVHLVLRRPDATAADTWTGAFASPMFRTVDVEFDHMDGMSAIDEYDTASGPTPPGYRNRTLTLASAYAEAGVELRTAGSTNVVTDTSCDLLWSESELHAAMVANFSLHRDVPQWRLWAFVATYFTVEGVAGIMFDTEGSQRQGMAIFQRLLHDFGHRRNNVEFHTYVHEIGHAFNLLHSWQKDRAVPHAPLGPLNGLGELSWMNYPQKYRSPAGNGSPAFWSAFPFHFSTDELRHLRHGFYRHIVPGGDDFLTHAAMDLGTAEAFAAPFADETGLRLELGGKSVFEYGEPVMAGIKLCRTGTRGDVTVTPDLGPKGEHTAYLITDPQGRSRVFRPIARLCTGHGPVGTTVTLTEAEPAVHGNAYLGFGSEGLYFADPGRYRITAAYVAPDGSRVVSGTRTVVVRHPVDRAAQEVGELMTGSQQGTLLAVLGSDAPQLQAGNDALREVTEKHGSHPLAAFARLAIGANAGRHFQHLRGTRIEVRQPDIKESVTQLTAAIEASTGDAGLDNITLNAAMRRLATVHAKDGNAAQAEAVLDRMVGHFRTLHVPRQVQRRIEGEADATRTRVRQLTGGLTPAPREDPNPAP
ncbi:hypothetical protein OG216_03550 [Streptomycetaceae bacterium NBC_01309]